MTDGSELNHQCGECLCDIDVDEFNDTGGLCYDCRDEMRDAEE